MTIGALLTWDDGLCEEIDHPGRKDTYLVGRIRGRKRARQQVRIGSPDKSLTAVSGMVGMRELVEGLGVIKALDGAVGSIKQRARGHSAGALLVGLAAAQLVGEDHLVGLDRLGADVAGAALVPVAELGSTTAAGLARRISVEEWAAVETGVHAVTARMLDRLPPRRRQALLAWRDDRSRHHRCGDVHPENPVSPRPCMPIRSRGCHTLPPDPAAAVLAAGHPGDLPARRGHVWSPRSGPTAGHHPYHPYRSCRRGRYWRAGRAGAPQPL
jgi:hypothetical protein